MTIAFKVLLKLMLILLMNARINLFSQDRSLHAVLDVTLLAVENEIQTKLLEKVGPLIRGLFRSVMTCHWRFYSFFSKDTPRGTGDHENYFNKAIVHEIDGQKFTDCKEKAVHIRSKGDQERGHISWWDLKEYIFFFSKESKYFRTGEIKYIELTRSLKPDYR